MNDPTNTKPTSTSPPLSHQNQTPTHSSSSPFLRLPPFDHSLSEDEKVIQSFIDNIQSKVDNGVLGPLRGKERDYIFKAILYPGFPIGIVATLSTFVLLRRVPILFMNRMALHTNQKSNTLPLRDFFFHSSFSSFFSTFATTTTTTSSSPTSLPPTHLFREPWWSRPFTVLIDAFFSLLVWTTTWVTFTDKKHVYQVLSEIPLVEGHSDISNALCDDFIQIYLQNSSLFPRTRPEFMSIHKEVHEDGEEDDEEDNVMTMMKQFVINCQKRRVYEKILQKQQLSLPQLQLQDEYREDKDHSPFVFLPTRVPTDILQHEMQHTHDENHNHDYYDTTLTSQEYDWKKGSFHDMDTNYPQEKLDETDSPDWASSDDLEEEEDAFDR